MELGHPRNADCLAEELALFVGSKIWEEHLRGAAQVVVSRLKKEGFSLSVKVKNHKSMLMLPMVPRRYKVCYLIASWG